MVGVIGLSLTSRSGLPGGVFRTKRLVKYPVTATTTTINPSRDTQDIAAGDDDPADDGTEKDREKRAHGHQGVAAHQIALAEQFGEDAVLGRTEEGRLHPHEKEHEEQQRQVVDGESDPRQHHDADLPDLDQADEPPLGEAIGELTGGRRKEEERQNEDPGAGDHDLLRGHPEQAQGPVGDEDHQGVLEQIVVERTEELGPEQRPEPPLTKKLQLTHTATSLEQLTNRQGAKDAKHRKKTQRRRDAEIRTAADVENLVLMGVNRPDGCRKTVILSERVRE